MLHQVVAFRDAKVEAFSVPMSYVTRGYAIRAFYDEALRQGSEMSKHPEDYSLFSLGAFDDQAGRFIPNEQPEQIALAVDATK